AVDDGGVGRWAGVAAVAGGVVADAVEADGGGEGAVGAVAEFDNGFMERAVIRKSHQKLVVIDLTNDSGRASDAVSGGE
ncbi:MAG: hypothetical protein Q9205_004694, partial [Flavoplaca limonia]